MALESLAGEKSTAVNVTRAFQWQNRKWQLRHGGRPGLMLPLNQSRVVTHGATCHRYHVHHDVFSVVW